MKAVIGVDLSGLYESALNFIGRFEIPEATVELLHVDEPSALQPAEEFTWNKDGFEVQKKADNVVLNKAEEAANNLGILVSGKAVDVGSPAKHLIDRAETVKGDLIAIGSSRKSKYGSFFFGSVGRALTIGSPHSILIAKGTVPATGKITAVFATDHSIFAEDAISLLIKLQPKGIERLVLVTALDKEMKNGAKGDEIVELRKYMQSKGELDKDRLKDSGIPCEYHVVEGEFSNVIKDAMKRNNAELLIMGAQGHGFIERMFIGSSSLQQVVTTPHSVLILRPEKP